MRVTCRILEENRHENARDDKGQDHRDDAEHEQAVCTEYFNCKKYRCQRAAYNTAEKRNKTYCRTGSGIHAYKRGYNATEGRTYKKCGNYFAALKACGEARRSKHEL